MCFSCPGRARGSGPGCPWPPRPTSRALPASPPGEAGAGVPAAPLPAPGGTRAGHPLALPPCQLHHLVSDDVCLKVVELYLNEKKRGAAGGNLSSRCVRASRETSYQWKAERCMADENCFKVRGSREAGAARRAPAAGEDGPRRRGPRAGLGLGPPSAARLPDPTRFSCSAPGGWGGPSPMTSQASFWALPRRRAVHPPSSPGHVPAAHRAGGHDHRASGHRGGPDGGPRGGPGESRGPLLCAWYTPRAPAPPPPGALCTRSPSTGCGRPTRRSPTMRPERCPWKPRRGWSAHVPSGASPPKPCSWLFHLLQIPWQVHLGPAAHMLAQTPWRVTLHSQARGPESWIPVPDPRRDPRAHTLSCTWCLLHQHHGQLGGGGGGKHPHSTPPCTLQASPQGGGCTPGPFQKLPFRRPESGGASGSHRVGTDKGSLGRCGPCPPPTCGPCSPPCPAARVLMSFLLPRPSCPLREGPVTHVSLPHDGYSRDITRQGSTRVSTRCHERLTPGSTRVLYPQLPSGAFRHASGSPGAAILLKLCGAGTKSLNAPELRVSGDRGLCLQ